MALKAGYKGIKKIGNGLKLTPEGTLSLDGSGPGGSVNLDDLENVAITEPANGDILLYDSTDDEWINSDLLSVKVNKTDIAPVENETTASQAYAIGQQFYLNGSLYKAKTAIAQDATFTVDTNCELAGSITEQIKASLFPLISEMTTPLIVNNNRVRNVVGGYKQLGKTVYVDVYATINIALDNTSVTFPNISGWGVLYNFPAPKYETELLCDFTHYVDSVAKNYFAEGSIRSNGYLYFDFSNIKAEIDDTIHIRGTYEAN